jgi:hypothetical protein
MKTLLMLGSLLLLATGAAADEVRLKDGRVLVGKVTERDGGRILEIETRDGTVRVPKTEVIEGEDGWRTEATLQKALLDLEQGVADTPFAHLQLATQARAWGLERELWQHLDAAVRLPADAEHAAQRARLQDFLAQLEPELLARRWRTASTQRRVGELLQKHRKDQGKGREAALLELLVREPDADKDLRAHARYGSDPSRRLLALQALVRRETAGNERFLWRTAILDNNPTVRGEAMQIARARGAGKNVVDYLTPGLMHGSSEVRVRTAEAFANLGAPEAIEPLVLAGPNAGKALAAADQGVRAHVAFLQQQAYIQDFDVEVAQASFIADPKIGVLQSGVVLDVTVHGVYEQRVITRAYRSALQRLAGSDPGAKPGDWAGWLAARSGQQPEPATPARKN